MEFLKIRKEYGNNFFSKKEIVFSLEKKTEKIILNFFLNILVCQSFEEKRNVLNSFKFFFCKNSLIFAFYLNQASEKLQKINNFFEIIEFTWVKSSFFFPMVFFKNLGYEMEFLLSVLKKGIYEGWVSFSTIKFYLFPFFKLSDIFFILVSKSIKKKNFGKQTFFESFRFKTSKLCLGIKKAYFFFVGGIFFRYFQLKNRYLSLNTIKGVKLKFFFFSLLTIPKLFVGKEKYFKNKLENISKFYFLSNRLVQIFPEWRRIFIFEKYEKLSFSNIWKKKNTFFLFSEKFFSGSSSLALKIIKKFIKIQNLFTNFSRFLLYFWNQLSLDWGYAFSHSSLSLLEIIPGDKQKTKKNPFGFFFLQFFPSNFVFPEFSKVSITSFKNRKYFLPLENIPLNSVRVFCFLKWPFSVLVTKNSINKYHILLRFFFRLKNEEINLLSIWSDQMSYRIKEPPKKFFSIINLAQQIFSFFRTLNYHLLYHVLEKNLQELEKKVTSYPELHQIIFQHEKFITICLEKFLISSPISYKILLRIIATSSLFCFFIRRGGKKLEFSRDKSKKDQFFKTQQKKISVSNKVFIGTVFFKTNFEKYLTSFLTLSRKTPSIEASFRNFEKILNFNRYYI